MEYKWERVSTLEPPSIKLYQLPSLRPSISSIIFAFHIYFLGSFQQCHSHKNLFSKRLSLNKEHNNFLTKFVYNYSYLYCVFTCTVPVYSHLPQHALYNSLHSVSFKLFFFGKTKVSSFHLFVYITSALLSLQLPFEAHEDASNTKMD